MTWLSSSSVSRKVSIMCAISFALISWQDGKTIFQLVQGNIINAVSLCCGIGMIFLDREITDNAADIAQKRIRYVFHVPRYVSFTHSSASSLLFNMLPATFIQTDPYFFDSSMIACSERSKNNSIILLSSKRFTILSASPIHYGFESEYRNYIMKF